MADIDKSDIGVGVGAAGLGALAGATLASSPKAIQLAGVNQARQALAKSLASVRAQRAKELAPFSQYKADLEAERRLANSRPMSATQRKLEHNYNDAAKRSNNALMERVKKEFRPAVDQMRQQHGELNKQRRALQNQIRKNKILGGILGAAGLASGLLGWKKAFSGDNNVVKTAADDGSYDVPVMTAGGALLGGTAGYGLGRYALVDPAKSEVKKIVNSRNKAWKSYLGNKEDLLSRAKTVNSGKAGVLDSLSQLEKEVKKLGPAEARVELPGIRKARSYLEGNFNDQLGDVTNKLNKERAKAVADSAAARKQLRELRKKIKIRNGIAGGLTALGLLGGGYLANRHANAGNKTEFSNFVSM